MRSRMLQLGLAAAAVLALAVTLGVYRGVIDVLLMVGIAAAVAGMYLLRRYARTVLVYNRHVESPAPIRCLERKKAVVLPTILEPPCDQWASQELNDTSLLGSDFLPMIARCRQTCHVDLGRRFCWRFVPAAAPSRSRSRGSRSSAAGAAYPRDRPHRVAIARHDPQLPRGNHPKARRRLASQGVPDRSRPWLDLTCGAPPRAPQSAVPPDSRRLAAIGLGGCRAGPTWP